jgi:hypothetical protein
MQKQMFYDYAKVKKEVEALGLVFDLQTVAAVDDDFFRMGLSQGQVDKLVLIHAAAIKEAFNPKRYGWKARLWAAALFLGWVSLPNEQ